jgi:hypothetical protein
MSAGESKNYLKKVRNQRLSFHYKECLLKYANEEKKKAQRTEANVSAKRLSTRSPEELKLILAGDLSQVDLIKYNRK